MSQYTIQGVLASAVADSGTFTAAYPSGTDAGSFSGAVNHQLIVAQNDYRAPVTFGLTFGTSNITVTNKSGGSWPAGAVYILGVETPGAQFTPATPGHVPNRARCSKVGSFVLLSLGQPDTADADGICASQSGTTATAMSINGALASSGVATFDVPRNVVAAWTGTAVLTVTGTDEYGAVLIESSASGTSLAGKKAFKTITSVVPSANITSATVGSGDVLGLPVFLPKAGFVLKEIEDNAAATAGTIVEGSQTAGGSTATTGDVRGTYDPNSATNGTKTFQLIVALPDPDYRGMEQYDG